MPTEAEKIAAYIEKKGEGWKGPLLLELRRILLDCEVEEGVKWGAPTYMNNGNVVSFAAFKNFISLWFYQGVYLSDPKGVLTTSDGTAEALRQWRFYEGDSIDEALLKAYVAEAVENSKKGKKLAPKPQTEEDPIPPAFEKALNENPRAHENFKGMSLSKRNEYIRHIAGAKREETQLNRIEKALEYLAQGLDLNHKYRK